jgi:hypothetical protein
MKLKMFVSLIVAICFVSVNIFAQSTVAPTKAGKAKTETVKADKTEKCDKAKCDKSGKCCKKGAKGAKCDKSKCDKTKCDKSGKCKKDAKVKKADEPVNEKK